MLLSWFTAARELQPGNNNALPGARPLKRVDNLPTLSETAARAIAFANDPNTTLSDYANLIRCDGALATGILKLANSAFYRMGPAVANLNQAVVRLGLRTCSQVVTSLGMRDLFRDTDPKTLNRCEILWRHGFFTACLCTQLNQFLSMGFVGEEFTGGLLHDLGRTFIALVAPDAADIIDPLDFDESEQRLDQEREMLTTDHAEIGASYCKQHNLPPALIACNRWHHQPVIAMTDKLEHRHLIALVALADHVANAVQRTHQIKDYALDENAGYKALAGNWKPKAMRLAEHLPNLVVAAVRTTRTLLKVQMM